MGEFVFESNQQVELTLSNLHRRIDDLRGYL
jgi:hypothetical protein